MAIGAVVSHRNFGFFVGSEAATDHHRGLRLSVAAAESARKMVDIKPYLLYGSFSSSCVFPLHLHSRDLSNKEFHQPSIEYNAINTWRRTKGLYQCCLSSAHSSGNWVQPRNLGFIEGQKPPSKHSTVTRTRAYFKSEEHEMIGTKLDSILSSEGANEVLLVEGVEQTNPWWKQFPKRWVMVLLCFTAFLLCNMDRVNMSIAILPMSKEFNWNSATVGLIQSSFFWGYLLTQVFLMFNLQGGKGTNWIIILYFRCK